MGIFSLNWFKSKKRQQELEDLQIEEQRLKNDLLRTELQNQEHWATKDPVENYTWKYSGSDFDLDDVETKPYKKVKLVNDVLTIVLNDGSVISKPNATTDDFIKVRNAKTESFILEVVSTEEIREERKARQKEVERALAIQKGLNTLKQVSDFEVRDNSVYLKGTNRTIPQLLVEKFIEIVETQKYYTGFGDLQADLDNNDDYLAHKRFFMWCCLNPRAEVADSLYDFLSRNSFRITKQGFFAALRNVVTLHGSNELVQFISNTYNKVKAVWKKRPDDYTVFLENGTYKLVHYKDLTQSFEDYDDETGESYEHEVAVNHGERIGGLTELYLDLPNRHENRFTDDWTKTFDIRIGQVVNMPINECNWSTQDCAAAGLHFTADQIHYVGCGDQSVLVLINPMKVVGIGQHKGRCYEYLPIMTVPREEATELLHDMDFDVLALDESFAVHELQNLEQIAANGFAEEAKKYDFNIPSISIVEIRNIVASLDEMKDEISKRVVNID